MVPCITGPLNMPRFVHCSALRDNSANFNLKMVLNELCKHELQWWNYHKSQFISPIHFPVIDFI